MQRIDAEEMHTTLAEKFLALVLMVFVLIGALWAYSQPLDRTKALGYDGPYPPWASSQQVEVLTKRDQAQRSLSSAISSAERSRSELTRAREAYRTQLDADQPSSSELTEYQAAESADADAQTALQRAEEAATEAEPAAAKAQSELDQAQGEDHTQGQGITFALRSGFVLLLMLASFGLLRRLLTQRSRWSILAMAAVGAATVMCIVLAADYLGRYIRWQEIGPLVLALIGSALTAGVFLGYQRFLARRIPIRRVRRGECPYCAWPLHDDRFCAGCGQEISRACPECHEPRAVSTPHCPKCGAK